MGSEGWGALSTLVHGVGRKKERRIKVNRLWIKYGEGGHADLGAEVSRPHRGWAREVEVLTGWSPGSQAWSQMGGGGGGSRMLDRERTEVFSSFKQA